LRVLLTPIGSLGDNLPFLGIGAELARRGHAVTVGTAEPFADLVRRCGLGFVPTVTEAEYRAATNDPEMFDSARGLGAVMNVVGEYNRRLFDVIREQQSEGPAAVVAHSLDFASRVIAEQTGLPVVRVHLQPSIVRTSYDVPVTRGTIDFSFLPRWLKRALWAFVDRTVLDPVIAAAVNELRGRAGLAPARRVFANQIDSPLLTLAMFPEWYAPPQPDWSPSLRQCGFPLFDAPPAGDRPEVPPEVDRFLAAGPAPVVFTAGSAMRFAHEFFAAGVAACATLGRRAILLTNYAEQVPSALPDGVARFDWMPLSTKLRRCAALVHHGGIGTTAAALAAGVPQVVVPFSHDQPDNAHRVRRLGVGRRIMPAALTRDRLAAALGALLASDDRARRCREVAALCAADDGIGRACDLIEAVLQPPAIAPMIKNGSAPNATASGSGASAGS
jgi:UDP:flavonoid glycosyltransferase YjiC (YdhE family)